MTNLVTSWLALYPNPATARDYLEAELGYRYEIQRINAWGRGDLSIPGPVQDLMRTRVIECHIPIKYVDKILELIQLPERK